MAKKPTKPTKKTKAKSKVSVAATKAKKKLFTPPTIPAKDLSVAAPKRKYGSPVKYKPEYCDMLIDFMSKGYSVEAFCGHINTTFETMYRWLKHPDYGEFRQAKKIGEGKRKVGKLMVDVERIKNSSEYISNLKTGEEIKTLRVGLDREIVRLKEFIDFKKLTNIIHSNERELKIVKNYREHFVAEFSRDGGKKILDLLGGSNMKSSEIEAQVSLIEKNNGELKEKRGKVGLDSTVIMLGEVKKIEDEIDGMETEKVKVGRRLEEFDLKLKGLRNEVVKLVEGFGVSVV